MLVLEMLSDVGFYPSPLPWRIDDTGAIIDDKGGEVIGCGEASKSDAALIVWAVNGLMRVPGPESVLNDSPENGVPQSKQWLGYWKSAGENPT